MKTNRIILSVKYSVLFVAIVLFSACCKQDGPSPKTTSTTTYQPSPSLSNEPNPSAFKTSAIVGGDDNEDDDDNNIGGEFPKGK